MLSLPSGTSIAVYPSELGYTGQAGYRWPDGRTYEGNWVDGLPEGIGTESRPDGEIYKGTFQSGLRDGHGELTLPDGRRYVGDFSEGARSGYGRAVAPGNLVYEGTWVADKRQGYGLEIRPDGSSYQGEWLADKRDGQGREQNADGTYHEGTWEQNRALGPGIRSDLAGIETSGIWNGDLVSNGLIILPTGLEYAGPLFREFNTRVSPRLQKWMHDAAARGDPYAQLTLGTMYLDYSDPAPDEAEARRWLKQAAEAGIAEAMYRLAITWAEDNPSRTVALLAEAAGKEHPGANEILGEYYQLGIGVPRNLRTAMRYFEQGMKAGSLRCRNQLAWLLATIDDAEIRNPSRTIEIIGPIALYSGSWQYLDTLAAGHAAAGHFKVAIRIQREALAAAASDTAADNGLEQLAMQQRLSLYESGKSFIEP